MKLNLGRRGRSVDVDDMLRAFHKIEEQLGEEREGASALIAAMRRRRPSHRVGPAIIPPCTAEIEAWEARRYHLLDMIEATAGLPAGHADKISATTPWRRVTVALRWLFAIRGTDHDWRCVLIIRV
jgi:hypothetical protein